MSDTFADLASYLPSHFLSDHHPLPHDVASSSSTESESDDDDLATITHRFTRSVSLQERPKFPFPIQKNRVFSSSSPTTPFGQPNEDFRDLIYALSNQVAQMKLKPANDAVFATGGLLGVGPCQSHNNRNRTMFTQQQQVPVGGNYSSRHRMVAGGQLGFGQSAWPPFETQRRQQPVDGFAVKPVFTNGRGSAGVKKGCAGTGVFLPRSYSNVPPEPKKQQVCLTTHLPARVNAQQPQANIHGLFSRQHQVPPVQLHNLKSDMVQRQNAAMLLQQRRSVTYEGVPETVLGQAEVVLPQEWTY